MATQKQVSAWQKNHTYDGPGYHVKIGNGFVEGHFNSLDGETVSRFKFAYNPFKAVFKHPDFTDWPLASGWLGILGCDSTFTPVPSFDHPDELYQWLREEFDYPRTTIVRAA